MRLHLSVIQGMSSFCFRAQKLFLIFMTSWFYNVLLFSSFLFFLFPNSFLLSYFPLTLIRAASLCQSLHSVFLFQSSEAFSYFIFFLLLISWFSILLLFSSFLFFLFPNFFLFTYFFSFLSVLHLSLSISAFSLFFQSPEAFLLYWVPKRKHNTGHYWM